MSVRLTLEDMAKFAGLSVEEIGLMLRDMDMPDRDVRIMNAIDTSLRDRTATQAALVALARLIDRGVFR